MSAFICSPKTFSRIYTGLSAYGNRSNTSQWSGLTHALDYNLHRAGYQQHLPEISLEQLMADLYALNVAGVTARYGSIAGFGETSPKQLITLSPETPTPFQLLTDLKCLRYQCSEGNVPETEGFHLLEKIIYALMSDIIGQLPQMKTTQWD